MPGMTKKALHEPPPRRHGGDEPPVPGYNAFTRYLRRNGISPGAGLPEVRPRFETEPGRQPRFDWKEDVATRDRAGAEYRFNVFSATLGYSRRHLFRRSPARTRDDLLACMYDVAVRLGGVPSEWLADNMSAIAAIGGDGRRRRDPRVERFAREAGFETVPCAPRTPETEGKVESANRFPSGLAAYEGDFDGREGLDEAAALWWGRLRGAHARVLAAAGICVLASLFDQTHKLFVPGREFDAEDLLFDLLGYSTAIAFVLLACMALKRIPSVGMHAA